MLDTTTLAEAPTWLSDPSPADRPFQQIVRTGAELLAAEDPELSRALDEEHLRQATTLSLVASCSVVDPSVLAAQSSIAVNVTAEGYPGKRYHAGCAAVDEIERLAVERAREVFGARYANVQPHSATTANYAVLSALMRPGETLLGMNLAEGGHLTHGSPAAYAGQYFRAIGYGLAADGRIDYGQVRELALEHRPKVIVCGATAYSRTVDFARFRAIADEAGAYLVADISHIGGLVAAGLHPSPVDHAHVTTTCTHKQLFGPRGGLILMGRDHDAPAPRGRGTMAAFFQRAVFPFYQGAPALNAIAAKARALALAGGPEFRATAGRILEFAEAAAGELGRRGYHIVSGGTENHTVLVDLADRRMSGLVAELALEECGIVVNKNRVPGDTTPALIGGGMRLGSNGAARRGMGAAEAVLCAELVDRVLGAVEPLGLREYRLPPEVRARVRAEVTALCDRFPLPGYPLREHRV
ncbi:serine hydroxymethyltransferase [Streptomyces sp. NBC_00338]|uniref:serine hydroxymethyltransferase n=1 Tax=Streptomyces sp. NBC_00338 TaxID=2975715 RepID=UPI0022576483|nr:serine hydroxymethyltransferase [Streptomyces sp. NBC_00338]MCX5141806.1 serine hydroxymethyltransferase [Streptomyces sp. NBC_00338]